MGYLDYAGLQHLWDKLKEKFAPKSHSHDDRYYTESEMNIKLAGKSNTDHTHKNVNDIGNNKPTTFAYSKSGMNYGDYSWLAGWNGYELRAVNKNQFATADHTHNTSSISNGSVNYAGWAGPIESAHIDVLRANRLAFLPASGVKIEYSVDGGTTWVDYGATDTQKASLFAMRMNSAAPFYTGKHTKADECTTKDQLRITITPVDRYASVNMLYLWVSVAGTSATVNISRSTIGAKETFTDVRTDVPISGWSGPNEIRFSGGTFGGGSTQTSNAYAYRFTFKNKADGKGSVRVMDIRMYGPSAWGVPNNMMEKDHIYNWDANQNVQFPAQVAATKFNGSSTGVVDYGDSNDSTIKVGYNGAGLTKDKLTHIAGYAKDGNQTVIKDVDRWVLQSWLNLNEMINTQLTTSSSTPSDNDFYISQYAGGGATTTTYHRRPISALWNYIKSKADAVYSAKSHTHTKSQITDFPASLKNPTALTIQTNGATAATYDGSAAKTVNVTKSNIGLGNVDNTADKNKSVASAAKLTTARTVSGGSDIVLDFKYDGSGNSTANIGFYSCKHSVGNTNNYPFHRFAKLDNLTGAYADRTMLVYITQDYNGGGFGICRLSLRTNNSSSASTVEAKWLVRSGLSADFVQVAIYNVYGKTYADAFIKINGTYGSTTISALESGVRGTKCRTWTLVDSNEVNGTTATDKKTSSECWKTIVEAGVAIHKQAYSSSASATDNGYAANAGSANSASTCTGNSASATKLTSSAGSAVQPVYFKDGKPVATTYSLNKTVPADAKFTDTNTWRGVQNNLTSTATDQSLSAAQGKVLKDLVDGKAAASHTHNYAGATSSGGSANSAVKLDTSTAGSSTKPVYFSGGKPVAIGYTIASSVPANAKFTDTNTWRPVVNSLTSDAADQSLSAAQGKILKGLVDGKASNGHTHSFSSITGKPALMESDGYHAETIEALLKQVQGLSPRMGSCSFTKDTHVANTWWNFIYIPHRTGSGDDNPDYGTLLLFPMVGVGSSYIVRAGKDGIVREVRKIYTSGDKPTKGDVGLGNVDNTADANKSVASAAGIKDAGDDRTLTLAYSKDGLAYKSYSWLAGWNGNELRAVDKNQFATAEHGVTASGSNYVRFGNGTQICWGITNCQGKEVTASFAVAFNNTNYAVTIMGDYASWADTYWITGNHITTSFAIKASGGSAASRPINWIAIGTWK